MLKETKGITQDLLDQSISYAGAHLPKGLIPFWTPGKKDHVIKHIVLLKRYGESIRRTNDPEGVTKGTMAVDLADDLIQMLKKTTKYNGAFQKQFLEMLHRHDPEFSHKRYLGLKAFIANIALCVIGLGVFYIVAGAINYGLTGRFFFCNQTETTQKVDQINSDVTLNLG